VSAVSVRAFLAKHGLAANRDLGQNFLVDESLALRLVTLAGVEAEDAVIEVGTGLGVMTRALAARARRVVTIEVDAGLVRALREEKSLPETVELRHADVLDLDLAELTATLGPSVRVVGNLPYSISSPLLRRLLDLRGALRGWSVMLQRELAERLVAEPGSRTYGSLTVLHRLTVKVERVMELKPGCFFPVPAVTSSFLRVTPRADAGLDKDDLLRVERVVRAAFGTRRKTLSNALRGGLGEDVDPARIEAALTEAGLDRGLRAERVEPARFMALARALAASG
jgi:16S rRNA (adenine1518-N6/adenine1519-N6)-dimethyltransferase